jgi:hypothetical protein
MSASRRKRRIIADDGQCAVRVTVEVINRERSLTRDEHNILTDEAASGIMRLLSGLPYLSVSLSRMKVRR